MLCCYVLLCFVGLCCYVMLCYVMLGCVLLCCVMLCCVMLGCVVMLCCVMLCWVVLCCVVMLCCVMLCCVMLCCVTLGCVMLCYVVTLCCVMLGYVVLNTLFTKTKIDLNWTLFKSTIKLYFTNTNQNNATQNTKCSDTEMRLHTADRPAGTPSTNDYASIAVFRSYSRSHTQNSERTEHLATLLHTPIMLRILALYSPAVTICTASWTFTKSTFCPHSVFMCFVWISEQTAIISLYSINWLVFVTETRSIYCAVRTVLYLNIQSVPRSKHTPSLL
jgi:hypothetical protein